jgi:hypothetical protein
MRATCKHKKKAPKTSHAVAGFWLATPAIYPSQSEESPPEESHWSQLLCTLPPTYESIILLALGLQTRERLLSISADVDINNLPSLKIIHGSVINNHCSIYEVKPIHLARK